VVTPSHAVVGCQQLFLQIGPKWDITFGRARLNQLEAKG
jgi:hypothetical protein